MRNVSGVCHHTGIAPISSTGTVARVRLISGSLLLCCLWSEQWSECPGLLQSDSFTRCHCSEYDSALDSRPVFSAVWQRAVPPASSTRRPMHTAV